MNKFNTLIFEKYGQEKNFDLLRLNILNVRETMQESQSSFRRMSIKMQFDYCVVISTIAVHTILQHMDENRPMSLPNRERFEYSIDRDKKKLTDIPVIHIEKNTIWNRK